MNRATVRDYMTTDVVTLRPGDGFKEIVRALADRGVSGAPVVDDAGKVLGVVSEGDLLHKEEFKTAAEGPRRYLASRRGRIARDKAGGDTAADLMSGPAVTVTADTPVARAARTMAERGVERLPVVGPDGSLVGVFSRADLLGVFLTPDRQLREEIITEVVQRSLSQDPAKVRVDVDGGVVTLNGTLDHENLIPIAVALTRAVDGVVDVVDELSAATDDTGAGSPEHR